MKLVALRLVALLIGLTIVAIAGPRVYPTGTTLYNPAKAFNTFVLITGGDDVAHLIDPAPAGSNQRTTRCSNHS